MKRFKDRWSGPGGYQEFLSMAVPLILSTGAWSIQEFVDRVFLAWYSPQAIAAAMPAGILNFSITAFFIGTASYVGTFVAQYFGAGRPHRIGPAVWQGVYVAILGGLFLAFLIPLAEPFFNLVGHEPEVRRDEIAYFQVLCLGCFPIVAASALAGFFSGRGRPWPIMWIHVLGTGVNILLNYLLIFGKAGLPAMGIVGAGWATVISAVSVFLMFLALFLSPHHQRDFNTRSSWRLEALLFRRLMRFGLPIGVQFFLDMISFTIFILLVGRLGTIPLAATNIAFNINTLAFLPMIGAGIAVSILVGQHLGADRADLAERSTGSGFRLTLVYMLTISLAYVVVPKLFLAPFAAGASPEDFEKIFPLAVVLLRFVAVFGLFDTMNIIYSSAVKGAGDTRFVMLIMVLFSMGGLAIPTYIAVVIFNLSLIACWVIVTIHIALLGFIFLLRYRGGKWKKMRVIEPSLPEVSTATGNDPA